MALIETKMAHMQVCFQNTAGTVISGSETTDVEQLQTSK